jgi:hypothetical protein
MNEKIFNLIIEYWIAFIPYIVLIFVVNWIKKRLKIKDENKKSFFVILISLGTSFLLNLLPAFYYVSLSDLINLIIIHLSLTFLCSAVTGFITIIIDKAIKAKIDEDIISFIKNFFNKGRPNG